MSLKVKGKTPLYDYLSLEHTNDVVYGCNKQKGEIYNAFSL